jgi:hypothetical protein
MLSGLQTDLQVTTRRGSGRRSIALCRRKRPRADANMPSPVGAAQAYVVPMPYASVRRVAPPPNSDLLAHF